MKVDELVEKLDLASVLTDEVLAEIRMKRSPGYSTDPGPLTDSEIGKLHHIGAVIGSVMDAIPASPAWTEPATTPVSPRAKKKSK